MFIPSSQGAKASTVPATNPASTSPNRLILESPPREQIRYFLLGTPTAVQGTIYLLHKLGYAEPNDWSQPVPTGKRNEVMAILTKRVAVE
ncbi:MAG: hypothetical protein AAF716_23345 [Cyanobacteria bacterium P01_D01_bin.1]